MKRDVEKGAYREEDNMRIHCFSGKQLSGVRCFVMRDLGAAADPHRSGACRGSQSLLLLGR